MRRLLSKSEAPLNSVCLSVYNAFLKYLPIIFLMRDSIKDGKTQVYNGLQRPRFDEIRNVAEIDLLHLCLVCEIVFDFEIQKA